MNVIKKLTFADYLTLESSGIEGRAELVEGELIELAPESGINTDIAGFMFAVLLSAGVNLLHLKMGNCELQTPILEPQDAANRYPDLVVLRPEHVPLTRDRMTITLEMPPPRFVVEVVSPGKTNRNRDYVRKRAQYAAMGIPEYVIPDPEDQQVLVLVLQAGIYHDDGCYQGNQLVRFPSFPELQLTAEQILRAGQAG